MFGRDNAHLTSSLIPDLVSVDVNPELVSQYLLDFEEFVSGIFLSNCVFGNQALEYSFVSCIDWPHRIVPSMVVDLVFPFRIAIFHIRSCTVNILEKHNALQRQAI